MSVLGLDLSLNGPGFCPDRETTHSMTMTAKDGDRRLIRIHDAVDFYLTTTSKPGRTPVQLAVIESVATGPQGGAQGAMDRVHGAARLALARYGVPFVYVSGTTLKVYATGSGRAEKQEMIDALPEPVRSRCRNDNEADAWWLAEMGRVALASRFGERPLKGAADPELTSLLKVQWPGTVVQCAHKWWCTRTADGDLIHPFIGDVCDKRTTRRGR